LRRILMACRRETVYTTAGWQRNLEASAKRPAHVPIDQAHGATGGWFKRGHGHGPAPPETARF